MYINIEIAEYFHELFKIYINRLDFGPINKAPSWIMFTTNDFKTFLNYNGNSFLIQNFSFVIIWVISRTGMVLILNAQIKNIKNIKKQEKQKKNYQIFKKYSQYVRYVKKSAIRMILGMKLKVI